MMEIGAAFGAMKGAMDLVKVAVEARDDAKAKAAISDMATRVLDAQNSALALADRASALSARLNEVEAQLRELQRRQTEREQYVLYEVSRGRFVYRFRASPEAGEQGAVPDHYLCQNCFDKGIKSVLRFRPIGEMQRAQLRCAEVGAHSMDLL